MNRIMMDIKLLVNLLTTDKFILHYITTYECSSGFKRIDL